jgi:hypothetical protein
LQHIDSIIQLEALLLLRANADEAWDVAKTKARLYAAEIEVTRVLERLSADGFLIHDENGYRYQCKESGAAAKIERLAALYASHLIPVTNMIHDKLRHVRAFADAFKLRKDP